MTLANDDSCMTISDEFLDLYIFYVFKNTSF